MSKKMFVYPINLRRIDVNPPSVIKNVNYAHKKDLTGVVSYNGKVKKEIFKILEEISSGQPKNLSDKEVIEYFDRKMKKRGFLEIELVGSIGFPYLYKVS